MMRNCGAAIGLLKIYSGATAAPIIGTGHLISPAPMIALASILNDKETIQLGTAGGL